jgi:hypothetical protein
LLENNVCTNCGVEYLSLLGSEANEQLTDPRSLIFPSGAYLGSASREIYSIQRSTATDPSLCGGPASCTILTVTVFNGAYGAEGQSGSEGLTQQVGSTIVVSGVTADVTMDGPCMITSLRV